MSFIDLMADLDWSEADMDNRIRAMLNSVVSVERQDELRTIMLGNLAQIRPATAKEWGEMMLVKDTAEAAGQELIQARIDMALLRQAFAVEAAQRRLALPLVFVETQAPDAAEVSLAPDPVDAQERAAAQAVIDAAPVDVLALVALRNRMPPPEPIPAPTQETP